jgi:hypothetical protein
MRRAVAALLACLPFDPRGRRALDETLLDWAEEMRTAQTRGQRALAGVLGAIGIGRTIVGVTALEVLRLPFGWLIGRLLIGVGVPAALIVLFDSSGLRRLIFAEGYGFTWANRVGVVALLLPQAALLVVPIALFVIAAYPPRERRVPAVGFAGAALVCLLAFAGWIVPIANQEFRVVMLNAWTSHRGIEARPLARGLNELLPGALVTQVAQARRADPALTVLLLKTGLAALAATLVLAGSGAAALSRRRRRWWVAFGLMVYIAGIAGIPAAAGLDAHAHPLVGLSPWLLAVLALTVSVSLVRSHTVTRGASSVE